MLIITAEDPASDAAQTLQDALSAALAAITGDSGRSSFHADDVRVAGALFIVARNEAGLAVGCAGLRPLGAGLVELKRMYARPGHPGTGRALLAYLESAAVDLAYRAIRLETRLVNRRAVGFYEAHGYRRIANYGKYQGNPLAVCFEKQLAAAI